MARENYSIFSELIKRRGPGKLLEISELINGRGPGKLLENSYAKINPQAQQIRIEINPYFANTANTAWHSKVCFIGGKRRGRVWDTKSHFNNKFEDNELPFGEAKIFQFISNIPKWCFNRGVFKIFIHSKLA